LFFKGLEIGDGEFAEYGEVYEVISLFDGDNFFP